MLLGLGDPLVGRLLAYDALEESFRTFKVRRDPACPACGESRGDRHRRVRRALHAASALILVGAVIPSAVRPGAPSTRAGGPSTAGGELEVGLDPVDDLLRPVVTHALETVFGRNLLQRPSQVFSDPQKLPLPVLHERPRTEPQAVRSVCSSK